MKRPVAVLLSLTALAVGPIAMPSAPAASNPVVASATGSGHIGVRTFSFTARKYADGTSKGQLQLNNRALDVVVHIEIDCLRVVGNTAHMSGRVTRVSNPDEGAVGDLNRLVVQDNGTGAKSPPDMISGIPATNPNNETCETNTLQPTRVVERGNLTVR
jgi:hypothetical protein